jgi:quinol monooxygenase YgiN
MISVIAKLQVQDGKADQTIEMFKELLQKVSTEEGTLLYSINRKSSEPNTVIIIERYKDKDALTAHSTTAHFKEFSARLGAVLAARPEITILEELGVFTQ